MNKNKPDKMERMIHILVWVILFLLPLIIIISTGNDWKILFRHFWLQLILFAIIFYINYLDWIDRYLFSNANNRIKFFLYNLLLLLFFVAFRYFSGSIDRPPHPEDIDRMQKKPPLFLVLNLNLLLNCVPIAFSIAIHSVKKIVKVEVMQKEAENIKLEAELKHLKYQLQPHFFFNSLNTTYALIDIDPEKAKKSIHNLSKLMRHLLYKEGDERIPLSDEIDFLNKYIELNEMRLRENVQITKDFPTQAEAMFIEIYPLIFISIVENSFKHGVSAEKMSSLHFSLHIAGKFVIFKAANNNYPKTDKDLSGSGIGIDNLKKRLDIIFPAQYSYNVEIENSIYTTTLKIPYKERV